MNEVKAKLRRGSKNYMILEYLESGGTLTAIQAYEKFNEMHLATRIYSLRKKGYTISSCEIVQQKHAQYPHRYYIEECISLEERTKHNIKYAGEEVPEDE